MRLLIMNSSSCPVSNSKDNQCSHKLQPCLFCSEIIYGDGANNKQDDSDGCETPEEDTFLEGISVFCDKLNANWRRFSQKEGWRLTVGHNFVESVCCQNCYKLLERIMSLEKLILETQIALNQEIKKMKDFIVNSEEVHKEQQYSVNIRNQFRKEILKNKESGSTSNTPHFRSSSTTIITSLQPQQSNERMPLPFVKLERLDLSLLPTDPTIDAKVAIQRGGASPTYEEDDNDFVEVKAEDNPIQEDDENSYYSDGDDWNEHNVNDNQQNAKMIKWHYCDLCGKGFKNQWSIPRHKTNAHPNGTIGTPKEIPFECDICGQRTTTKMSLLRHKKNIHDTKKPRSSKSPTTKPTKFDCSHCSKSFNLKAVLDRHVKLTHKSKISCVQCHMTFDTQRELMHHKYETHKKHKLTPSFLKRLENAKESITSGDDVATIDATQQSCVICSQEFTSWGLLDKHLIQHERNLQEKSVMCYFCDHKFALEQSMWAHLKTSAAHYLTKVEFSCDHSTHLGMTGAANQRQPWVYPNIKELESHFGTEHQECGILKCGDCGWPFVDKSMLDLHRLVHLPRINYKYRCPVCQNTFVTTDSLQHHYNSCHGANLKLHKCGLCGLGFPSKTGYAHHMLRMHNDDEDKAEEVEDKLHNCSECSKRFKTAIQLYHHKRQIHVTSQCPDCGEVMSKSRMSLHRRMKHDVEQHLCTKCGKVFKTATDLRHHMSSHGEYAHACQYCESGSRSLYHLRRHIRRMHKDQLPKVEGRKVSNKSNIVGTS